MLLTEGQYTTILYASNEKKFVLKDLIFNTYSLFCLPPVLNIHAKVPKLLFIFLLFHPSIQVDPYQRANFLLCSVPLSSNVGERFKRLKTTSSEMFEFAAACMNGNRHECGSFRSTESG